MKKKFRANSKNRLIFLFFCVIIVLGSLGSPFNVNLVKDQIYNNPNYTNDSNNDIIDKNEILNPKLSILNNLNHTWGGNSDDRCFEVIKDDFDNIFLIGYTESWGTGGRDVEIVKYNSSGDFQWNRTWGGVANDEGYGAITDTSGNIYITGITYSYGLNGDLFLIKYNSSGDLKWNKTWGGSYTDEGRDIVLDSNNNIYIGGSTASFGHGDLDFCLIHYNSTGDYQWNETWGSINTDKGWDITIDKSDNIYIVGEYNASPTPDWALVRFNTSGIEQWNRTWGNYEVQIPYSVDVDNSGNIYVGGYYFDTKFGGERQLLLKYNRSGDIQWNWTEIGALAPNRIRDVYVDSNDDIFVISDLWITYDNITFHPEACFTKINNSGIDLWKKTWGKIGNDFGRSLTIDSEGIIYLGGYTDSSGIGDNDMFLARFLPTPESFKLYSDADNPDTDGNFTLFWKRSDYAQNYSIYQHTEYISKINATIDELNNGVTSLSYSISGLRWGVYYFIIIAFNRFGNTSSNCIQVIVELEEPPGPFLLSSNAGNPDVDGKFELIWNASNGARNYSIYQSPQYITKINDTVMQLVNGSNQLSFSISELTNGTYYFKILAFNDFGNTSSNCIQIIVKILIPGSFVLYNVSTAEIDGNFILNWSSSIRADNYTVVQLEGRIIEYIENGSKIVIIVANANSLKFLINETTQLTFNVSGLESGSYLFHVIAHNKYGNLSSNYIQVIVSSSEQGILSPSRKDNNDDDKSGIEQDNLIVFISLIIVISSVSVILAFSVYHFRKTKMPRLDRIRSSTHIKKLMHPSKTSKEILKKLTNKRLLLQIFTERELPIETPPLSNIKLTIISKEFLNKLDNLEIDLDTKREFLKEMLQLSPKERVEILENILKKLNSNNF